MTELMRPKEVAAALRVTIKQVHNLIAEGELSVVRIGKRTVRIPAHSVDDLLKRGLNACSK